MSRIRLPCAAATALLAAVLAVPAALAQPAAPTRPPSNAGGTAAAPVEMGRPQRTHGGWRSSRIVGATVYNDHDERIGTVDDLIVGQDGRISEAVLSIGGFLRIGAKLVAVPYDQLRFEEQTETPTADVGAPPAARVGASAGPGVPALAPPPARPVVATRVVLPGATRETLTAQPGFNYRD
jgi:hypothetical protein